MAPPCTECPTTSALLVGSEEASASVESRISMPTTALRGPTARGVPYKDGAPTMPDRGDGAGLRLRDAVRARAGSGTSAAQRADGRVAPLAPARHPRRGRASGRRPPSPRRRALLHLGSGLAPVAEPRLAALGHGSARAPRASRRARLRCGLPEGGTDRNRRPQPPPRRLLRPQARHASERSRRRHLLPAAGRTRATPLAREPDRRTARTGPRRPFRCGGRRSRLRRAEHAADWAGARRDPALEPRQPPARAHPFSPSLVRESSA